MTLLTLWMCAACRPGSDAGPSPAGSSGSDVVDTAVSEALGGASWVTVAEGVTFGSELVVGSDLDHDGVREWAAQSLGSLASPSYVHVFEGEEPLAVFPGGGDEPDYLFGMELDAGRDANGDGFPDLAVSGFRPSDERGPLVATSTELTSASAAWWPDREYFPAFEQVALASDGALWVLSGRWNDGSHLRVDRVAAPFDGAQEVTEVFELDTTGLLPTDLSVRDLDGDGAEELVFGRADSFHQGVWMGEVWVCPSLHLLDPILQCTIFMGETIGVPIGTFVSAASLSDGTPVLLSSSTGDHGDNGAFVVFELDGTVRGVVRGTRQVRFGTALAVVPDEQGVPWVYVGDLDFHQQRADNQLYRFRLDDLQGELTDQDAHTTWSTGRAAVLGAQIVPYQATEDDPVKLLVSEPYRGQGYVYLMDPWAETR